MMMLDEDLTGQQFGELTVVKRIDRKTWECKCSCGKVTTAYVYRLKNGGKKSCGCLSKSSQHKAKTNGYVLHPLYACYYRMRHRCENKADKSYLRYGGRGIKVCDEWKNDIMAFIKWGIENGYQEGLSIDRIDNDGDYSPKNCRWADAQTQSNNRRSNRFITYNDETHTVAEWSRITGIRHLTLEARILAGWSAEEALTTPTLTKEETFERFSTKTVAYKDGKTVGVFRSIKEAARKCGFCVSTVSSCIKNPSKQVRGYTFKRYEEVET